jgi:hypothetical protein
LKSGQNSRDKLLYHTTNESKNNSKEIPSFRNTAVDNFKNPEVFSRSMIFEIYSKKERPIASKSKPKF